MSDLRFEGLTKHYGAVKALDQFTHTFAPAQVHALIGKNGSGKSTFIKMFAGAIQPTSGTMYLKDKPLNFDGPGASNAAGIVTVHQEFSLVPSLSVAENIYLGRLPKNGPFVSWKQLYKNARSLLSEIGAEMIPPKAIVSSLSIGRQQIVEIAKAMSLSPQVLLLDEPTSALATAEVDQLFALINRLRSNGVTIIYISHRLAELPCIADTVTTIRDGRLVGSVPIADATPQVILNMMFGELPPIERPRRQIPKSNPALSVSNLALNPYFHNVSFDLYRGEVLGIAGMLGAGRTELLHTIFGARPADEGTISIKGKIIEPPSIPTMKGAGMGYASEDRKTSGLVQTASSHANLCLAGLQKIAPSGWTNIKHEQPYVQKQVNDLHIKIGDPMAPVSSLSGGNQQKIVVGGWLNDTPNILLFDEPGRGVDVEAKRQIYEIIWKMAAQGLSSIVVSTELEDLTDCCDRILVLHNGTLSQEFLNDNLDPKDLYAACMASNDSESQL